MSEPGRSKNNARRDILTVFLVVVASLSLGLFGLPELGKRARRSDSPFIGRPAPDFMLRAISPAGTEKPQRLSDLQGKTVLLDFFASWCGPCREQAPIVDRLARRRAGAKLAVFGVNTSDQLADAEEYLAQHRPSYPVLFDAENQAATAFDVTGLPTLLVIDAHGIVRAVEMRVVSEAELDRLLEEAQGS